MKSKITSSGPQCKLRTTQHLVLRKIIQN